MRDHHFPEGRHCLLEARGCCSRILDDREALTRLVHEAAARSGATLLSVAAHRFEPQGVTCLAMLAESHLSVHTWPELGYAAIDAFTCGKADPEIACQYVAAGLQAQQVHCRVVQRGIGHPQRTPQGSRA